MAKTGKTIRRERYMKKSILICIDRDGTLIYDDKYHLGHQKNWKRLVSFLPGVMDGLKLISKKLPEAKVYMISNQSGVAIKNYPLLTSKKSKEVCEYILKELKIKGAELDGYEICGHIDTNYVKRRPQYKFEKKLICNCSCIKPRTGMVKEVLKKLDWKIKETEIYVVGDRYIDVRTGLNVKGYGVLIPFEKEPGNIERTKRYTKTKDKKKIFIAKDFLDAAKYIIKKQK